MAKHLVNMKIYLLHYWPALCSGITILGILSPLFSMGPFYVFGCLIAAFAAGYIAQRLWNHYGRLTNPGMYGLCLFATLSYGELLDNVVNSKLEPALFSATIMGGMLLLAAVLWLGNNWDWAGWKQMHFEKNANGRLKLTQFWPALFYGLFLPLLLYKVFTNPTIIAFSLSLLFLIFAAYIAQVTRLKWDRTYSVGMLGLLVLPNSEYHRLISNLVEGRVENTLAHALFLGMYFLLLAGFLAEAVTKSKTDQTDLKMALH